ncbi:MAG: SMC-Scp complex subunit ScpB [Micrococcales bacterium]|nr:MAG: SMC-Scp complex subunit ScpB [Micrococcales bacterium]PIE28065.1 MAG: SMC-Scp complex subunit ScpB [Micrococcales bacterium]
MSQDDAVACAGEPDQGDGPPAVAGEKPGPVEDLRGACEAVLMVADDPVTVQALAAATRHPVEQVQQVLAELGTEYAEQGRGFELAQLAGGWRVLSSAAHADVVARFVTDGQTARLSQAALETLAVIAYRQPVSRARVAAIRGVSVDGVVRTLMVRGLITEAGTDESSGAHLYATTPLFLERMGLVSLEQLPPLAPHLPDEEAVAELAERS